VTSQESAKWLIYAPGVGFDSPVTYGAVPEGAEQLLPAQNAAPAPLASGDMVNVFASGVSEDGYSYYATGLATVP
jgi:hypothetical protein